MGPNPDHPDLAARPLPARRPPAPALALRPGPRGKEIPRATHKVVSASPKLGGLDWFGLVWIGLDWFGLVWIGLDWFGLVWIGLD